MTILGRFKYPLMVAYCNATPCLKQAIAAAVAETGCKQCGVRDGLFAARPLIAAPFIELFCETCMPFAYSMGPPRPDYSQLPIQEIA